MLQELVFIQALHLHGITQTLHDLGFIQVLYLDRYFDMLHSCGLFRHYLGGIAQTHCMDRGLFRHSI
jgi:hypothetical protein